MISSIQQDSSMKVAPASMVNASNAIDPSASSKAVEGSSEDLLLQQAAGRSKSAGTGIVANGRTAEQDKEKDQKKLNKDEVSTMTEALNDFMENLNCNLEFKFYDKLDQLSVKMVDKQTQEVIKEFPPEEVMKAMIKTKEWIGVFLDKNA
ncbi:MAG: flagellar protein FlaG [Selenomonadaceae bacterium]